MTRRSNVVVSTAIVVWALLPASPSSAAEWEKVTADQVPAPIAATIKRELGSPLAKEPRVKKRIGKDGALEYRVDGETLAGEVDLELTLAGALTRKKEVLTPEATPKAILAISKREFGTLALKQVARLTKAGKVTYELDAEAGDRTMDLVFTAEGGLQRKVEEWKDPKAPPTVAATPTKALGPAAPLGAPKKP